ncbi:MAG: DUF4097 family beta strand repeat-containing protein [Terracidiphilus sp.]|jgi:DUF4097 and DUF4098 domain-containing protein YvlB
MMHKASAMSLILLAGAFVVFTLGCKHSGSYSQAQEARADSGPLSISKMGGGIDVAEAPRGATLTTMGGDIHLGSVSSYAHLKTMGGNITIDHAEASVDATTMGGSITIKGVNGSVQATTMAGDITAHLVGSSSAQRDVHLTSNSGTIRLIVPKDFPMDLRIKLAYTQNANEPFDIIEHLGLTHRQSVDWDTSQGTPRKYIYAEGRVGSGQNHVEINTINGDVILKQE